MMPYNNIEVVHQYKVGGRVDLIKRNDGQFF